MVFRERRRYAVPARYGQGGAGDDRTGRQGRGGPGSPAGGPDARSAALRPATTPARTLGLAARRSGICLLITVALLEGAFLTDDFFFLVLACFAFIAVSGFLGYGIVDAWQETRSRTQSHRPSR